MTFAPARPGGSRLRLDRQTVHLVARALAALAVLVAVKSFVVDPLTGHFQGSFEDFQAYIGAARSVAAGGSPYAQFDPSTVVMSGFDYPPFAALLVRPLALLGGHTAMLVWLWATLVSTAYAVIVVAKVTLPASWPRVELAVITALAFAPAAYNYWIGQINGFIFLLLALALREYARDHQVRVGVLLGLAAAIKIGPVVLVVLLLRRRWWRGTAAMAGTAGAATAAGIALIGIPATRSFVSTVLPALDRPVGWIYNQTVAASLSRVFNWSVIHVDRGTLLLQGAALLAGAATLAAAGWAARTSARDPQVRAAEFGIGIMAMLVCGSLAWYSHFTALVIPLFAAIGLAAARGWRVERSLLRAATGAAVVFGVIGPLVIASLSMRWIASLSTTALWWPFLQLCSLPCLSAVWLLAQLGRSLSLRRERPMAAARGAPSAPAIGACH